MKFAATLLSCLLFFLFTNLLFAVSPNNFINDNANVLTAEQKLELESLVRNFQTETGNEIGVLVVSDLKDQTIEELATQTVEDWGVGKKGQDNGILLVIAINNRELRIEVGYGLEGTLTDLTSSQIIRDVITPEFKKGDYYTGIKNGLQSIITVLRSDPGSTTISTKPNFALNDNTIGLIFFLGYLLFSIMFHTKSWWLGG